MIDFITLLLTRYNLLYRVFLLPDLPVELHISLCYADSKAPEGR